MLVMRGHFEQPKQLVTGDQLMEERRENQTPTWSKNVKNLTPV